MKSFQTDIVEAKKAFPAMEFFKAGRGKRRIVSSDSSIFVYRDRNTGWACFFPRYFGSYETIKLLIEQAISLGLLRGHYAQGLQSDVIFA